MKKVINKIKDCIEDRLRGICGPMSPGTRVFTIVILIVVFAAINFYVTFKAIYNIGREDKKWEQAVSPIVIPEVEFKDEEPTKLQQEMKDFFNEHFNREEDDTTTKR